VVAPVPVPQLLLPLLKLLQMKPFFQSSSEEQRSHS